MSCGCSGMTLKISSYDRDPEICTFDENLLEPILRFGMWRDDLEASIAPSQRVHSHNHPSYQCSPITMLIKKASNPSYFFRSTSRYARLNTTSLTPYSMINAEFLERVPKMAPQATDLIAQGRSTFQGCFQAMDGGLQSRQCKQQQGQPLVFLSFLISDPMTLRDSNLSRHESRL